MAKRLTQEALGAKLGISQSLVARLARRGMPTDSVAAARRWRAKNLDPTRGGKAPAASESLEALRKRKLSAEAQLLERRAAIGPEGMAEVAAFERGLRAALVALRGVLDSLHPRLLEHATDAVCAPGDPRYPALHAATFSVLRNTGSDAWAALSGAIASEAPELRPALLRVAQWFNGPQSAAAAMLRDLPDDGRDRDR